MRLALRALFPAALLAPSAAALTLGGGPPSLSLQDANSLLVTQPDTPVWLAPAVDAGRRGALGWRSLAVLSSPPRRRLQRGMGGNWAAGVGLHEHPEARLGATERPGSAHGA